MNDAMTSEFSPRPNPEAPATNLLAAGDITAFNSFAKLSKDAMEAVKKFARPALITASAIPFALSVGCGNIPNPFSRSQEVSPTPVVTPIKDLPKSTSTPEVTATATPIVHATEIPPTPKVDVQQPKVISIGSSVESDPASQSPGETIKFLFPEGIVNGKSPLIPEGDTLSVSFKLKSEVGIGISQCSLSLSDLFDIKNHKYNMGIYPTNEDATQNIASSLRAFQSSAKFSISDADKKIANKTTLNCVRVNNGVLGVNLSLPNESFTYTDKAGSHLINPAERFASGKVGLGIKRGNIAPGRFALKAEDIKIENSKGRLVATANTPSSNTAQPDRIVSTETPTRRPDTTQVPIKPPNTNIKATETPTPKPEEEKWTLEWAPNETVSVREWWDDMASKGYINIDAIARQYAGEEIGSFLADTNLVPNPVKYGYNGGPAFINNCNVELDKLVAQGRGHIKITSDAYALIPGGVGCQIFTKDK